MLPYRIAMICVFLPLLAVHSTLIIGISFGNLDACIPYWSHCHSISATGRQYPEFFVFKALLIPTAVFMAAYWLLLYCWLQRIDSSVLSNRAVKPKTMLVMGITASVALIVYSVTLGATGDPYALARRIGVVLFFAFTAFGHLVLLSQLDNVDTEQLGIVEEQNRLTISSTILITTAIATAAVGYFWDEQWDNWENAYEWWFALLMISMFYQIGQMWRKTAYQMTLTLSSGFSAPERPK